jgi:hypothetical protein
VVSAILNITKVPQERTSGLIGRAVVLSRFTLSFLIKVNSLFSIYEKICQQTSSKYYAEFDEQGGYSSSQAALPPLAGVLKLESYLGICREEITSVIIA